MKNANQAVAVKKRAFLCRLLPLLLLCCLLLCCGGCGNDTATQPPAAPAPPAVSEPVTPSDQQNPAVSEPAQANPPTVQPPAAEKPAPPLKASQVEKVKKDKYQTTAVPKGKPQPVEPQEVKVDKKTKLKCTISIDCQTILANQDDFDEAKVDVLPVDGIVLKATEVEFSEGESVFDVLLRATKDNKIHMEFVSTPVYNSNYIEGINNLYEFDCGELSGWLYRVNGWFPNYGSSRYKLQDGDKIEWLYSCDLGRDIGCTLGGKQLDTEPEKK